MSERRAEHQHTLRVLYLSWRDRDNPEAGGAETFTERTAEELAARGHHVTLFTSHFPGAASETLHGDVRVLRRGNRFSVYWHGLRYAARHRDEFDIVVDVQNGVPFWTPLGNTPPVVNVVHHVHREQWPIVFGPVVGRVGWLLESRVAPVVYRSARYVTVSCATRTDLATLGVSPDRVDVVYSGNDLPNQLDRFAAVPPAPTPSLAVLGRLVPHKHVEEAIDAVAELLPDFPGLTLDVVGTGYWEQELRAHAQGRGVSDQVRFTGFVDEDTKHEILARSWAIVVPSHKEGWGLNIVEAGLHGTPAVAYASAGGPSESIRHEQTGLLAVDRADLVTCVRRLLHDDALRTRLGAQAREHARSFDWAHTAERLEHTLLSVLGRAARPLQPVVHATRADRDSADTSAA